MIELNVNDVCNIVLHRQKMSILDLKYFKLKAKLYVQNIIINCFFNKLLIDIST